MSNPDGGPVRTIRNFNQRIPSGRYFSFKCRRPLDWEAFHERHLFWICDADARVRTYLSQPHKLVMHLTNGRSLIYFPDLSRQMEDGTTEIIETKKTKEEVSSDPDYELKLEFARDVYETERGWTFRILTAEDDIEIEPLLSNARTIKRDGSTRILTPDIEELLSAFDAARGPLAYAKAVEALTRGEVSRRYAQAKLHALVIRRLAGIDIRSAIGPQSMVSLVSDPEFVLPVAEPPEAASC
jgi:hypothetical protein